MSDINHVDYAMLSRDSSAFADVPLKDLFLATCESLLDIVFQYHMMTFLKTNLLIKRLNITMIH